MLIIIKRLKFASIEKKEEQKIFSQIKMYTNC